MPTLDIWSSMLIMAGVVALVITFDVWQEQRSASSSHQGKKNDEHKESCSLQFINNVIFLFVFPDGSMRQGTMKRVELSPQDADYYGQDVITYADVDGEAYALDPFRRGYIASHQGQPLLQGLPPFEPIEERLVQAER